MTGIERLAERDTAQRWGLRGGPGHRQCRLAAQPVEVGTKQTHHGGAEHQTRVVGLAQCFGCPKCINWRRRRWDSLVGRHSCEFEAVLMPPNSNESAAQPR